MERMNFQIPEIPTQAAVPSCDDMVKMRVETYNALTGHLTDYDCKVCRNKGYIAQQADVNEVMAECGCMKIRRTLGRIRESGLEKQLKTCTFKSFETPGEWQKKMKNAAVDFLESDAVGFLIGGQSGCGKTHLCTAMIGQLIKQGYSARYFVWREDSVVLKTMANKPEYIDMINEFKKVDVLYIDDLFKQDDVKDADKKLAFELIDYRYRQKLRTIISTEKNDEELIGCDEATAGRIFQMCKRFRIIIPKDRRKNYRLK